jgi:uncharacterized membrane protein
MELALAVCLAILAVLLQAHWAVHAGALWRDEIGTVTFAGMSSLSEIWQNLRYDNFPPLGILVLRAWTRAGLAPSDSSLRVLGAAIGLSVVATVWLTGFLLTRRPPLLALALLGLSPLAVRYGDAIRPHGLGLWLILIVYGLVWKAIDSREWRWFAAAALSAVLSVQVLYQNAVLLLGICIAGSLVTLRRRSWRDTLRLGGIGLAAALSLVPYLGLIWLGREWSALLRQPPTWGGIWEAFSAGVSASGQILPWIWVLAAGASLIVGFSLSGRSTQSAPHGRVADVTLYAGTCLIAVVLVFLIFLRVLGMDVRPWYLLGLLGIAALAMDTMLTTASWSMAARWGRLALATVVALFTFPAALKAVEVRQTNMDLVAAAVQQRAAKGDLIVATVWHYGIGFRRYYSGSIPWMTLPPIEELRIHRYDLIKEQMMTADQQAVVRPVMDKVAETLKSGGRVWFVGGLPPLTPEQKPELLPPAPSGPSGWAPPPYEEAWAAQVAYLVQTHALHAEFIPVPVGSAVNPYEDIPLLLAEGWRSP